MSDDELAKDIGLLAALAIGIGTMIGAGIFVLPGTAVERTGPVAVATFALGGVIAIFTALSASELGTAMPKSGGAYFYVNRALGPLFGSIAGWANWLGLAFASAFYMYGLGEYVNALAGLGPVGVGPLMLEAAKAIGLLGVLFFVAVNYVGAKETGGLQIVIVVTLLAILALFTAVGLWNAAFDSLRPFAPPGATADLLPVTAIVFVSYLGFVQITSVAEEIKDPGRNLPIAVIGSVLLVTAIYVLCLLVMLAAVPNELVAGNDTAVIDAANLLFGQYSVFGFGLGVLGTGLLLVGGLLATASSANASILASSRINFAMGREKIISPKLNEIHPRFATPYRSIGVTGGLILLFLLFGNLELLATAGSVLHLVVYGLLNLALIVMREADPAGYDPDFRVPLYPVVPLVGATVSFALIAYIDPFVLVLCVLLAAFAALWYVVYARRRVEAGGVLEGWVLDRSEALPDAAVSAVESVQPTATAEFRVVVPVANPETGDELVALGSALADHHDGTLHAVHIVEVPDQTALEQGAAHLEDLDEDSEPLFELARETAADYGVEVETHRVLAHRAFEEVFDSARRLQADAVVMGWSPQGPWAGRLGSQLDDLAHDLPCDFLVFRDRGFDPSRVLLPTAGGTDSDLSAEVAKALRDVHGAEVSVLNVVGDESERARATGFVGEWADEHGLGDATLLVDTGGDVEAAIRKASADHSLVLVGATGRGLLSRLVRGSPAFDVVEHLDTSVVLAERPSKRSIRERLFGRSRGQEAADAGED